MIEEEEHQEEAFRDRIATVEEDGSRKWIFPKKPSGRFYNYRKIVSYVLLIFLFAAPHIKVGGEQLLLFNVIERKFVIFGKIFWPQDLYLFAIAFVIGIVSIILFTIIYGRLFCGWVCPQTIFMEMVFRRIEYWIEGDWTRQKKLAAAPWNGEKIRKRLLKHTIFWLISFLIANTFLAYIIGSDELWSIQTGTFSEHYGGFIAIVIFTTVFYMVFSRLREQVCTTICPYGRLQGVLLDPNSMVVAYDHVRGEKEEGRAKFRKNEDRAATGKGDCIDCHQCVNVCPTGIDIRNGTQLECVNCTACIDECDHMMDAVGLEKGLIRFVSENGIKNGTRFQWTRRVKAYTALLIALMGVLIVLLVTRSDFEAKILRQRGTTHHVTKEGNIGNIFEINLTNKTKEKFNVELKTEDSDAKIDVVVDSLILKGGGEMKERFVMSVPINRLKNGKVDIDVIVYGNGKEIERVRARMIGPLI
ncbi:MAG: cytochrome c oxidase accessory protein CcoG [Flavobacteriales bacterium]|nr:cytochrome c oxidase accessory protein CcoG [Flavobacteriales bacterium]PIE87257.1 MAG: cytochrome c oxidase accessory protein CcoG [Bacteroidota bacterium]